VANGQSSPQGKDKVMDDFMFLGKRKIGVDASKISFVQLKDEKPPSKIYVVMDNSMDIRLEFERPEVAQEEFNRLINFWSHGKSETR